MHAHYKGAGQIAAKEHFHLGLGDPVSTFLGAGD